MKPNEDQTKEAKTKIQDFKWLIPVCCREGHPDCPHVPKRQKKVKKNIGL